MIDKLSCKLMGKTLNVDLKCHLQLDGEKSSKLTDNTVLQVDANKTFRHQPAGIPTQSVFDVVARLLAQVLTKLLHSNRAD